VDEAVELLESLVDRIGREDQEVRAG